MLAKNACKQANIKAKFGAGHYFMFKRIDLTKIATWGYGLAAVFITAAANTGASLLMSFATGSKVDWHQLAVTCGISGLIAALLYLKSSPLPPDPFITVQTTPGSTTTVTTTTPTTETDKKTP